jgi:hypothetical protein
MKIVAPASAADKPTALLVMPGLVPGIHVLRSDFHIKQFPLIL